MKKLTSSELRWLWPRLIILNLIGSCLLWSFRHQVISHDWQTTQGTIVKVEAVDQDSANGGGGLVSTRCMIVTYRYKVADETYVGNRFQPSGMCLPISQKVMAHPPIGHRLTVWYDASDPDFAVLKPAQEWDGVWLWFLLLILMLLGNGAFIEHAKRRTAGGNQGGDA